MRRSCSAPSEGSWERFGLLADGTSYDMVFVFDDPGYNFEPSEIMAAFGLVQLERLAGFNARRRHCSSVLVEAAGQHLDIVTPPRTTPGLDTTWM